MQGALLATTYYSPWNTCAEVFNNGPSKISGRQPLKNLKWYGLLSTKISSTHMCKFNNLILFCLKIFWGLTKKMSFLGFLFCFLIFFLFLRLFQIARFILYTYAMLRKKCPYSELFWSVFYRIILSLRIQSECEKMRPRMKSEYGHFLSSVLYNIISQRMFSSM